MTDIGDYTRFDRVLMACGLYGAALRRATARWQCRAYAEAAKKTRLTGNWGKVSASGSEVVKSDAATIRHRSRALILNDPIAGAAINSLVSAIVGTGIRTQSQIRYVDDSAADGKQANETANQKVEDLKRRWEDQADARGRMSWFEMQTLWARTVPVDGDAILHRRFLTGKDHSRRVLPLAYEFIDVDQLVTSTYRLHPQTGNEVIGGIEFNKDGVPVAYHCDKAEGFASDVQRIPADQIHHGYRFDRPNMHAGMPWLTPCIPYLAHLSDVIVYTVIARKAQAAIALVKSRKPGAVATGMPIGGPTPSGLTRNDAAGNKQDFLEPGQIYDAGESEVHSHIPTSSADLDSFVRVLLRAIGVGIGVSYEWLSGDYERTNFAGGRLGDQHQWRKVNWCHEFGIKRCHLPVHRDFIDTAIMQGKIPAIPRDVDPYRVRFSRPKQGGGVNPLQEIRASIEAIEGANGIPLSNPTIEVEKYGEDWDEVIRKYAENINYSAALGVDPITENAEAMNDESYEITTEAANAEAA